MKPLSITPSLLRSTTTILVISLLVALILHAQKAQAADTLSQVHKIYIDTSTSGPDAADLRKHLIESLRKDHRLEVVNDQSRADAVLKPSSAIWVKGYVSVNPRSPGSKYPVYGGFLSAQLVGRDGETLWSYLVTPSRYASAGIHQDLTDQLMKKLLAALHDEAPTAPASPSTQERVAPHPAHTVAGATFPAPLYQAWIESFRQHHPDIQINYNGIGTVAGIQQLHDNKITFAASDVPFLRRATGPECPEK